MQTSRRTLIGIIIVLIVGAGLVTGIYFSSEKSGVTAPSAPKKIKANFNTYEISPTSRGEVIITVDTALKVEGETFNATLSVEDAAEVRTGQRVLLHDSQSNALEQFGKVSAVTPDQGKINISVIFDGDDGGDATKIAQGKIITSNIPDAQRLPLSALVDNDGKLYLWEIVGNSDGTSSVYFKAANIMRQTKDYVVLDETSLSTNIFVLNPDDDLQDGQKINVKEVLYSGPEMNEEQRIAALIERSLAPASLDEDIALFGQKSMPGDSGIIPTVDGCDQTPQIADDFMKKIRALGTQQATAP